MGIYKKTIHWQCSVKLSASKRVQCIEMVLLSFSIILLTCITTSSQICQLTECFINMDQIQPQIFQLCSSNFNGRKMRPLITRNRYISKRRGHIFDVFYDPVGHGCVDMDVILEKSNEQSIFFLNINCDNENSQMLFYSDIANISSTGCLQDGTAYPTIEKKCHHHRRDELRFTVIDTETLLIEDLSHGVPPGTREFFRNSEMRWKKRSELECPCLNLTFGQMQTVDCMESHEIPAVYSEKRKNSPEIWIAMGLLLTACCGTVLGRYWITSPVKRCCWIGKFDSAEKVWDLKHQNLCLSLYI